ncbi:polyphosphate polymerase domain-containing protein [Candidatus Saccharibacteria bacterium]|nr:polyphosphate polymerase domain-containing protein [Candidatus Saccharibacteria bacterium]
MDDKKIERIEEKFLITKSEKTQLMRAIKNELKRDKYYKEEVLSLYFDTPNYDLAIKSIDRPNFREKVRVRAYMVPKRSTPVFFEVKTKLAQKGRKIGNKRRLLIKLGDFYKYYNKGQDLVELTEKYTKGDSQQMQVARELDYLVKTFQLEPKVVISTNRTAFAGKGSSDFRLTFDENLRFRETDLKLEKGSKGEKYFPAVGQRERSIIMEVKTMRAMPPWFVAGLSELHIYPIRFSKYGKIYQLITERNRKNV